MSEGKRNTGSIHELKENRGQRSCEGLRGNRKFGPTRKTRDEQATYIHETYLPAFDTPNPSVSEC